MINSGQLNLALIAVGWSTVKWRVNCFCVYLTELRWYVVDLSWLVKQHYLWHLQLLKQLVYIRKYAITLRRMNFS